MVKHKKRYQKFNSKFQMIPINTTAALGTLASGALDESAVTQLTDDFWVQSVDVSITLRDATAGEGPLSFGFANSDLTTAEIIESIDSSPTHRSDIIARERARRPVRRVGQFAVLSGAEVHNDGKEERVTIKMYLAEGDELSFWTRNNSGATLTTGAVISLVGKIYGEWR